MRPMRFLAVLVFMIGLLMVFTVAQRRTQEAARRQFAGSGPGFALAQREIVTTPAAPAPDGPWSQAVRVDGAVWCAAQTGLDPATGRLAEGGVAAQSRQALANLRAVLAAAGCTLADAVQAQVFLADLADLPALDAVWAEHFPVSPPARATAQVARLPHDARVAIALTAQRGSP